MPKIVQRLQAADLLSLTVRLSRNGPCVSHDTNILALVALAGGGRTGTGDCLQWVGEEDDMRRLIALVLVLSVVGSVALSAEKSEKQKRKSHDTQVIVVFMDTQR